MATNLKPRYAEMKAFLRFFSARFLDQRCHAVADRPMALLERHEQVSSSQAESALRMAVNNCLEISSAWPLSQVVALDAEMRAAGVPSLSHVRSGVWGRYAAMLKRKAIRNPDELAVAQAVLSDPSLAQGLPAGERADLDAMVRAFGRERPKPSASVERGRSGKPGAASRGPR